MARRRDPDPLLLAALYVAALAAGASIGVLFLVLTHH